ncbi:hypothetical protein H5410_037403, partial [Solanum commersonii]
MRFSGLFESLKFIVAPEFMVVTVVVTPVDSWLVLFTEEQGFVWLFMAFVAVKLEGDLVVSCAGFWWCKGERRRTVGLDGGGLSDSRCSSYLRPKLL